MSLTRKGRKLSPRSELHSKKISLALRGRKLQPRSEETKQRIREALLGSKHTEERKEKIRYARLRQVIPFRDTSIEIKLQNLLKENGIEFETHYPILGQPDIFIKPNICIFADGCYWHKCPECGFEDRLKTEKDLEITNKLKSQGYVVIRLWEHQINKSCVGF